jgi:hypothetical protein
LATPCLAISKKGRWSGNIQEINVVQVILGNSVENKAK